MSDENIARSSGFLGNKKLPDWFRPSVSARAIDVRADLTSDAPIVQDILMQADGELVLRFGAKKQLILVGVGGVSQQTDLIDGVPTLVFTPTSRQHYLSYSWKHFDILCGKTDKVYGLRVPDHIAYSRLLTRQAENDQSYGVTLHYYSKYFDVGLGSFAGDFFQSPDLRQKGVSASVEFEAYARGRIGGTALASSSDYVSYRMGALLYRTGLWKDSSLINEFGLIDKRPTSAANSSLSETIPYGFSQGMFRLLRGVHLLPTLEFSSRNIADGQSDQRVRLTPAIQVFPWQRVELRFDFQIEKVISVNDSATLSLFSQVHVTL